jgi:hypothetical protein
MTARTLGSVMGHITGSTCGDACWHAREEICRCSCGGANHGILNRGGECPRRTARIDGLMFELVAVISTDGTTCAADFFRRVSGAVAETIAERFPGIDQYAYGAWRQERTFPVADRKISETQSRWPEVAAVPGAARLLWSRPAGTAYRTRAERAS